jgi:hypothetical protein
MSAPDNVLIDADSFITSRPDFALHEIPIAGFLCIVKPDVQGIKTQPTVPV